MIDYNEEWTLSLLFHYRGSVAGRAAFFALPSTLLCVGLLVLDDYMPDFRQNTNLLDLGASTLWSAATASLVFMIAFRTNGAIVRFWEGTGLLHQMRGEWFDTVSNCISFSIKAGTDKDKRTKVKDFRHALVRLMSLAHGYALEEISGNAFEIQTIDVHGLDRATRRYLKECHETCGFNKVEMSLHLIQSLITNAFQDGVIDIPAPILSRVYQTISRGFVHLLNTKKITDTKFPFPYTQLISILLLGCAFLTPVLLSSFVTSKVFAAILTFIPLFSMSGLNYIATEIENPFGRDDNDLPMDHFQKEMDRCLLMLLHPFADTVPTVGYSHVRDFVVLFNKYGAADSEEDEVIREREEKLRRWDTRLMREQSELSCLALEIKDSNVTESNSVEIDDRHNRASWANHQMANQTKCVEKHGDLVSEMSMISAGTLQSHLDVESKDSFRIASVSSGRSQRCPNQSNVAVQTVGNNDLVYDKLLEFSRTPELTERTIPFGLPWRLHPRPVSTPRRETTPRATDMITPRSVRREVATPESTR